MYAYIQSFFIKSLNSYFMYMDYIFFCDTQLILMLEFAFMSEYLECIWLQAFAHFNHIAEREHQKSTYILNIFMRIYLKCIPYVDRGCN